MTDSSMSHDRRRHRRDDDDEPTPPPPSQNDDDHPYPNPYHPDNDHQNDIPTTTPDHFQEIPPHHDHLWPDPDLHHHHHQQQQQHSMYNHTTSWISAMVVGLMGVRYYWYRNHHHHSGRNHDALRERPPSSPSRTNPHDDNDITTTTARIRSFLRSSIARLVTWMEDILYFGIYDYVYRLYQMLIEWTLYSIQYAAGVWHYCSQVTVSLQRLLLRQQRLDYYNSYNHHHHDHYIQYNNNNNDNRHSIRRGMSQIPDLVEATVDINDDVVVFTDHVVVADRSDHRTTMPDRTSAAYDESLSTNPMIIDTDNDNDNDTTKVTADREAPTIPTTITDPMTKVSSKIMGSSSLSSGEIRSGEQRLLELEPAFLHERDYPANWMVYHPILQRVILKIHANDAYHHHPPPHPTSLRGPKP